MDCGYGAYVDLMKRYPLVTDAFLQLKPGYQKACLRPLLLCIVCHSIPLVFCCSLSAFKRTECRSKSYTSCDPLGVRASERAVAISSILLCPCGGNGALKWLRALSD